jgi:ribosome-binding factor A
MEKEISKIGKRNLERLESEILNILNHTVKFVSYDPDFKRVSFTYVKIAADKSFAHVFVDSFDSTNLDRLIAKLNNCVGLFRRELSAHMKLYRAPKLHFEKDTTIEKSSKIESIINNINK